jgi:hypothetical protein
VTGNESVIVSLNPNYMMYLNMQNIVQIYT